MGIIKNFFGRFSKDLGIDLGTANTLVYVRDKGIVINEPSVVAVNERTGHVLAVGQEARNMIGRTPSHIVAIRPLVEGVVSDFEVTEKMLKHFIEKVHRETFTILPRPRIVIGIPLGVTEVERKAVEDAALNAGAREVFLIEEPMAAAIGARVPVQDATGHMIVDIGGGTTEIAVVALGGVVTSKSLRIAGDELNRNIVAYHRDQFNLLLGERTAEELKIAIGSASEDVDVLESKVRGRDIITGLPREMTVSSEHVREAIGRSVKLFSDAIKDTLESTPPELVADIYERGILMSGGGALLRGFDKVIQKITQVPVKVVDDPLTAVVRGTGRVLEDIEALRDIFVLSTHDERIMK
ncbi:MAG: rod shape-determining protein [Candidatus Kerfeldbacteria bacterium RIFCSPHIGHO2_12_FULL_48_17]|uniref:Cell shape-determining protein MreB n=1 Tax=Candidatus Kerfeldbacteria bacterium RIFCSPHIGHO2_12_FULL_48_17 TaxID=1798542 RepID=A0A1G2AXM6_9BACT|nr:MAG: rod shape-determining protein [Candidatus Kerfeldbacteria bacterium RIFCSPHIGHO2_12_FULL_48_17]